MTDDDDDMIRRGDVSKTVQYHVTDDDDRNTLSRAIAALPAVTVGVRPLKRAAEEITKLGWTLDMDLLDELRRMSQKKGFCHSLSLEDVEEIALATEARILAALETTSND